MNPRSNRGHNDTSAPSMDAAQRKKQARVCWSRPVLGHGWCASIQKSLGTLLKKQQKLTRGFAERIDLPSTYSKQTTKKKKSISFPSNPCGCLLSPLAYTNKVASPGEQEARGPTLPGRRIPSVPSERCARFLICIRADVFCSRLLFFSAVVLDALNRDALSLVEESLSWNFEGLSSSLRKKKQYSDCD